MIGDLWLAAGLPVWVLSLPTARVPPIEPIAEYRWVPGWACFNVLCALLIVVLSATLTELLVRKLRKAKRHDE